VHFSNRSTVLVKTSMKTVSNDSNKGTLKPERNVVSRLRTKTWIIRYAKLNQNLDSTCAIAPRSWTWDVVKLTQLIDEHNGTRAHRNTAALRRCRPPTSAMFSRHYCANLRYKLILQSVKVCAGGTLCTNSFNIVLIVKYVADALLMSVYISRKMP